MHEDDMLRFGHILDAAREARFFMKGKQRQDLETDRKLVLALVKELETVGEAAFQISQDARETFPQIPWKDIIGMRHHLIHGYFKIDLDVVWDTVTNDLRPLIAEVQKILEAEERK